MAVYKRTYKPYAGTLTPSWSRLFILTRYAYQDLFESRLLLAYLVLCFVPSLIAAIFIYLNHSDMAQRLLGMQTGSLVKIDSVFFRGMLSFQATMSFLLTAWIGPTLISADLANNALPLYLCRPFTRVEYVLGKMMVLFVLVSAITWVPGLLLFAVQANLAGTTWLRENWTIAFGIFVGSWVWILLTSLLAMAASAWIKWRLAASGVLFGIFFVAAGFGTAASAILRTHWGKLLNLAYLFNRVLGQLLHTPADDTMTRSNRPWLFEDVPYAAAWAMLAAICLCCLLLLNKRLRAKEVA